MLIKYYGHANERRLLAGENWGGQLATPLANDVVWGPANNWVVDTSEAGLSESAIVLILGELGFDDITGIGLVLVNEAQQLIGQIDPPGVAPHPSLLEIAMGDVINAQTTEDDAAAIRAAEEAATTERLAAQAARNAANAAAAVPEVAAVETPAETPEVVENETPRRSRG